MIRRLRLLSLAEATSYVAFLIATVVRAVGGTDTGVTVLGPIHGVLYLIFVAAVIRTRPALTWPWSKALMAMIMGSLPLGGYWLERTWLAPLEQRPPQPDNPAIQGSG